LRLDRPHFFSDAVVRNLLRDARSSLNGSMCRPPHALPVIVGLEERTLAEQRAVLGLYCLASA
jgi:hypothetical protein